MAFLYGFALGFSLILAIGAQNAFVLRQGLANRHIGLVVWSCALSDAVLVSAGVAGAGHWLAEQTTLAQCLRYAGALFLLVYAFRHAADAWRGDAMLRPAAPSAISTARTLATCLALTWLNPHVYIDTVLLVGSASLPFGDQRWLFALGAVAASFVFFFTLGYGARRMSGFLSQARVWRALDTAIALLMAGLATRLALGH